MKPANPGALPTTYKCANEGIKTYKDISSEITFNSLVKTLSIVVSYFRSFSSIYSNFFVNNTYNYVRKGVKV